MHLKEQELRELATRVPFVPFVLVTASGDRYNVPTSDHIFFAPNIDDDGAPVPEEERSRIFTVFSRGSRQRLLFFDTVTAIEVSDWSAQTRNP